MENLKIILVADSDLTRTLGLMGKKPLREDECAFFTFPRQGKHSFWNKNVSFPISLIFCDENHIVSDIKYLEAEQTQSVSPDNYKVKFVIEAHKEVPSKFGIKKGKKIVLKNDILEFV